jgi:hypothetical protein
MNNYGSPFHKVAGVFSVPALTAVDTGRWQLAVDYWFDRPCDLIARLFVNGREVKFGLLPPTPRQWVHHRASPLEVTEEVAATPSPEINTTGCHGIGTIAVTDVRVLNHHGEESYTLAHGKPVDFLIDYAIRKADLAERAQVVIALHRDGVQDVCRFITRDLFFDASRGAQGTIRMHLARLPMANGTYSVTVLIAEEGYYDREQVVFYSINPGVYACVSRVLEIVVKDGGIIGSGTGVIGEAEWSLDGPRLGAVIQELKAIPA